MQNTGLKRKTIDKFYTAQFIVKKCIDQVKNILIYKKMIFAFEPSAGNGSFIPSIKTLSKNVRFYDLKPENKQIIEQDYLEFDYNTIIKNQMIKFISKKYILLVVNLQTIKFIKKSCEYCDTISFILLKALKKTV